jgi:putative CocE/NonD family hydrolase
LTERFLDRWLKGKETGIDEEPAVQVFVMGKNQWRYANKWPPAGTEFMKYYLHSSGKANTLHGDGVLSTHMPADGPPDRYTYDLTDPVPSHGGFTLPTGGPTFRGFYAEGPVDQRRIEERPDVLVYSTEPLAKEVEVTGPIVLKLFASSSAPDTDFTGKLIDVYPDGRAINLCEGILRARYRESQRETDLLEPGTIYEFPIDLMVTANVFQVGHRIRLEVSSSNFPQFDRNPNTGHAFGMDAKLLTAKQTIYHCKAYPSHLILPVNPSPIR